MQQIKNVPLGIQAAHAIRENIITGKYLQGQKLTEEECAEALGLSRVCVREAFLVLQEEGLLVKKVNKSTSVAEFTENDVKDIYYLRLALEKMCLKHCIEKDMLPLEELERILTNMEKISQKEEMFPMDRLQEDLLFHAAIVDAAGNSRAAKVWHEMQGQILTVLFPIQAEYSKRHDKQRNVEQHRFLLEAIKTKDTAVINPVLERHMMSSLQTLLMLYRER